MVYLTLRVGKTMSWKFRVARSTVAYHFGGKSSVLSWIQFRFLFFVILIHIPIHELKSQFHDPQIPFLWHMGYSLVAEFTSIFRVSGPCAFVIKPGS